METGTTVKIQQPNEHLLDRGDLAQAETIQVRTFVSDNVNCKLEIKQNPQYQPDGFNGGVKAMTEEALAKQQMLFATYNNRRDVYQGELAMQERARIAAELEAKGFSPEQVAKAIPQQKKRSRKKAD